MSSKIKRGFLSSCLFFTFSVIWLELVLMLFTTGIKSLNIVILFSFTVGFFLAFLISVFPFERIRRVAAVIILSALSLLFITEILLWRSFGYFYSPETIFGMAESVVGSYGGTVFSTLKDGIFPIFLSLIPLVLFIFLRKSFRLKPRLLFSRALTLLLIILLHFAAKDAILQNSKNVLSPTDSDYYSSDFEFNSCVSRFGLCTSVRLNTLYSFTGIPDTNGQKPQDAPLPTPNPLEYNISEFDLFSLASNEKNEPISSLASYFLTQAPTEKNKYSGSFNSKNIVFICAEALSPYVIDSERTPTLYKLSNDGFSFKNYYQPSFGESTLGGEYALLCSQVPGKLSGETGLSMQLSCKENLKYSLPSLFADSGYECFGFHNNSYSYYSRNITHSKLGLNWYGVGGCVVSDEHKKIDLGELISPGWPRSDEELIMSTFDILTESKNPFFAYYLTVSGHNNYSFSENTQARKNRLSAEDYDGSEQVKAYIACQMELEKALTSLISKLEEAEILDDTVIVLSNDHYPYGLSSTWQGNNGRDCLSELAGKRLDRYERERGVFFIWNSEMKNSVNIEKPVSGFDVMPTVLNLFGIEYDSRLLAGRDALSNSKGVVFFSDYSFISENSAYFAESKQYDFGDGTTADDIQKLSTEVQARIKSSRKVRQLKLFKHLQKL